MGQRMPETRDIIATRLSEARRDRGWSIAETARRMNFSRSRYSNWELNYRAPKYDELELAANVLGVSPAYLAGWTDQPADQGYQPINRATLPVGGDSARVENATDLAAYRDGYLDDRRLEARQLMAIRVDDDTMADVVQRGDVVLADMRHRRPEGKPDLFALLVNGRAWVRWIRPELDGNYTLSAEDKRQYPDQQLTDDELADMAIIGRIARIERDR